MLAIIGAGRSHYPANHNYYNVVVCWGYCTKQYHQTQLGLVTPTKPMVKTMAKKAKTENMPVISKSYGFAECKPLNAIIDRGRFDDSGNFVIPEIDVSIPANRIADFVQHALTRALTQDTSGLVSVETIDAEIAVWQAGYPCLPAWRKARREALSVVSQTTGKPVKLPYGRIEIESAMRQVTRDDPRIPIVEAMDDEQFADFMVLCATEDFVIDALDHLAKRAKEKAEREATDKKAVFMAMLANAKVEPEPATSRRAKGK